MRERQKCNGDDGCCWNGLVISLTKPLCCLVAWFALHRPFFHIYAFTGTMLYCAWRGQQVITTSTRFDLEQFCRLVQEHQPQRAHLVPPIILGLAKHPIIDQYDLSSLQMIVSAAAPLGKDTENDVKQRLRTTDVKQAWGMSELSPIGTNYEISEALPWMSSRWYHSCVSAYGRLTVDSPSPPTHFLSPPWNRDVQFGL